MELYNLTRKYTCIMTLKECPICGKEVDKRGYTQHIRKCKEIQENKESENMTPMEDNKTFVKEEIKEESKEEPEPKNLKSPKLVKIVVSVAGLIAVLIISILMLISPKSKDSTPKKSASKFHKNHLNR